VVPQCAITVTVESTEKLIGHERPVVMGSPSERMLAYCDRTRELVVALLRRSRTDTIERNLNRQDLLIALELTGQRISLLARLMMDEDLTR